MDDQNTVNPPSGNVYDKWAFPDRPSHERPLGVTLIAAVNFIAGAIALAGLFTLLFMPLFSGDFIKQLTKSETFSDILRFLFIGILSLLIGIGLWRLRPWGRYLAIVVYGLNIVLTLYDSFSTLLSGYALTRLTTSVVIIYYLFTPKAREAFREKPF